MAETAPSSRPRGRHRRPPGAGGPRALIATVQVLGLAVWFSASAVVPDLKAEWGISSATATWLTCTVQLGFVAGAVASAALTLADRIRPERLLGICAASAAACTLLLAAVADGPAVALVLRTLTGVFLAGVYPVGMKLMTSWSGPARRARDLGVLVAALTVGSALPHVFSGIPGLPWRGVLVGAALASAAAALVAVVWLRPGPLLAPAPPPDPRYAARMLRERGPRLVVLGYLGHMWELYALWTWMGSYLEAGRSADAFGVRPDVVVFVAAGLGGALGCLVGGRAADRWGRARTVVVALVASGVCCLLSPLMAGAGPVVVAVFCTVWGAVAVADSAVLTTSMSEVADKRYVGTALTVLTALGFLLTVASIQTVPVVAELVGWPAALAVLALGPMVGAPAMLRVRGLGTGSAANRVSSAAASRPVATVAEPEPETAVPEPVAVGVRRRPTPDPGEPTTEIDPVPDGYPTVEIYGALRRATDAPSGRDPRFARDVAEALPPAGADRRERAETGRHAVRPSP